MTERIRIALVTATLDVGGSERQMLMLARNLPRDRFEPSIVLFRRQGSLIQQADRDGIELIALQKGERSSPSNLASRLARGFGITMSLTRLLRRRPFDVVDAWLFHAYVAAAVANLVAPGPILVAGRRSLTDARGSGTWIDASLARFSASRSRAIVANSDAVAHDAVAHGDPASKLRVIRNGVEIPEPLSNVERAAVRARWQVDESNLVVASVANYKRRKGLELAIVALARLKQRGLRAHLVLIGSGSLRSELETRCRALGVEDVVRLVGFDPRAEHSIQAADVAIHLSESEGLPNAVLEAAAAGLPVIATRVGGTPEIVEDGVTGLLVDSHVDAVAAALARFTDPSLRSAMGSAARVRTARLFNPRRMADSFATLYEELVLERSK